jgi:hypothetical protein
MKNFTSKSIVFPDAHYLQLETVQSLYTRALQDHISLLAIIFVVIFAFQLEVITDCSNLHG